MINEFVKAWDKNNQELLKLFEKESPTSYQDIVEKLVTVVLNPYFTSNENEVYYPLNQGLNISRMTVINDGAFQGTILYIIPCYTYEPSMRDYYITNNEYGSCSGCDTFEWIEDNFNIGFEESEDIIGAAKEFHTLALHLLQSFKSLGTLLEEEE